MVYLTSLTDLKEDKLTTLYVTEKNDIIKALEFFTAYEKVHSVNIMKYLTLTAKTLKSKKDRKKTIELYYKHISGIELVMKASYDIIKRIEEPKSLDEELPQNRIEGNLLYSYDPFFLLTPYIFRDKDFYDEIIPFLTIFAKIDNVTHLVSLNAFEPLYLKLEGKYVIKSIKRSKTRL